MMISKLELLCLLLTSTLPLIFFGGAGAETSLPPCPCHTPTLPQRVVNTHKFYVLNFHSPFISLNCGFYPQSTARLQKPPCCWRNGSSCAYLTWTASDAVDHFLHVSRLAFMLPHLMVSLLSRCLLILLIFQPRNVRASWESLSKTFFPYSEYPSWVMSSTLVALVTSHMFRASIPKFPGQISPLNSKPLRYVHLAVP